VRILAFAVCLRRTTKRANPVVKQIWQHAAIVV
jgi:hypothetical protein